MRKPQSPPSFDELMEAISSKELLKKIIDLDLRSVAASRKYLHWDEHRNYAAPGGLTAKEYWFATKLARQSMYRKVDLYDSFGVPFVYALPDEVLRGADHARRQLGGAIAVSEEVTNPATKDRYLVNSLMEEAITSSQLEGASTEKPVAKTMIRTGRGPRNRSEQMIINNYHAMEFIGSIRNESLTLELICEIQRIVTRGTLDNPGSGGRMQSPDHVRVKVEDVYGDILHDPPPASELEERMIQLCDFANGKDSTAYLPGVVRAMILHFMIGYNHPFEDGNGRTARLVFYWSMLNQGYWLTEFLSVSKIIKKSPVKYGRAFLYTETDANDLTYFVLYHLNVLRQAIDELNAYLAKKMDQVRDLRGKLNESIEDVNSRQLAVLHNALKDPGAQYTVQSHQSSHRVGAETARKDLAELERRGLLLKRKVGKKYVFYPPSDIASLIESPNLAT